MKACAELRVLRVAGALAGVLALSSCAFLKSFDAADKPAPPAPTRPAAPVAKPVDKGNPDQRFAQALDQSRKGQAQEAEAAFAKLTVDFPEFSGPWTNLGIIYAKSNRRPQAIGALQRAVALNPQNAVAWDWLGILYRQVGELTRARQAYDKALAIDPDHALAHYNLALLLDVHLRSPREALEHYRAYQRLAGKQDLKVMAWVAEIETPMLTAPAAAPAPPAGEARP